MREVVLCNLSCISNDYINVIDFATKDKRDIYYESKRIAKYKGNYKNDGARETITFPTGEDKISNANYLYIDYNNKRHFYFITNRKHLTETLTELEVELDVWTTYMFDYTLLESYVDRCHQDRWTKDGTPIINTVDEGLALGEYIMDSKEDLYTYNNGLIITSTTPLGKIKEFKAPSNNNNGGINNDGVLDEVEPPLTGEIPSFDADSTIDKFTIINVNYNTILMEYNLGDFVLKTLASNFSSSYGSPAEIGVYYKNRFLGAYDVGTSHTHDDYRKATLVMVGNILYLLLGGISETNIQNFKRIRIGNLNNMLSSMTVNQTHGIPIYSDTLPLFKTSVTTSSGTELTLKYGYFNLKFRLTNKNDVITDSPIVYAELYYKGVIVETLQLTQKDINYNKPVCNLALDDNYLMVKFGDMDYPNTKGKYVTLGDIETLIGKVN